METLTLGLTWYVVFIISVSLHEGAHAWAGYRMGERTADEAGLNTLHPLAHIRRSPFGMIIVPILSFLWGGWMIGWASVPYDRQWAIQNPKRSAHMAMAGPTMNFMLMILAGIFIRIGLWRGWFYPPDSISIGDEVASYESAGVIHAAAIFVSIFFSLNLVLCVFNLIPLPPLDGSSIPLLFLNESASRKYMDFFSHPSLSMIGLLIAWLLFGSIFRPIHVGTINLVYFFEAHYF